MKPECPKCESKSARRIARTKLRHRFMHLFGLYPWECVDCQKHFFSRERFARSGRHSAGEVYTGSTSRSSVKLGSKESKLR